MYTKKEQKLNTPAEELASSLAEIFVTQIKSENKINNKKYEKPKRNKKIRQ